MATLSVNQAFELVKGIWRNISNIPTGTRLSKASSVNHEIRDIIRSYDPESLIEQDTISILDGTSAYALPSDFGDIDYPGTGVFTVDSSGNITQRTLTRTGVGSSDHGYWISKTDINFTPTPGADETVILRYMTKHTKFTDLEDTFLVGDEWEEVVQNGLLPRVAQFNPNRSVDDEATAGQRYANSLDNFTKHINRVPKVFARKDLSRFY